MIKTQNIETGKEFLVKKQETFDAQFLKSIKNQKINSIIICKTSILYANVRCASMATGGVNHAFPIVKIDDLGFWIEVESNYFTGRTPSASYYLEFANLEKINKDN